MKEKFDFYKKLVTQYSAPVIAALIGYQALTIKQDVLAEVKLGYVSKTEFSSIEPLINRINIHEDTLQQIKIAIAEIKANNANQTELLKEVRNDIKILTNKQR